MTIIECEAVVLPNKSRLVLARPGVACLHFKKDDAANDAHVHEISMLSCQIQ